MSSEHPTESKSGGVEVVADQGDDGSFEIRLERQTGEHAVEDTSARETPRASTWSAQPEALHDTQRSKRIWAIALGAIAAIVLLLGIVFAQSSQSLKRSGPQTVDVSDQPSFRGYVIAGEEPERVQNVRLDDTDEDDDVDDDDVNSGADVADDDAQDDEDASDAGPPRINLRSAASGAVPSDDDERELTREEQKERELEEMAQELKRGIDRVKERRAERARSDDARDDDFDEHYDDYDDVDDAYDEAYDEDFDDEYYDQDEDFDAYDEDDAYYDD